MSGGPFQVQVRKHHCFRAMFTAFTILLSNDFACSSCLFFTWAFRADGGGLLGPLAFVRTGRWMLIYTEASRFIKLSVCTLAERGHMSDSCVPESHCITNTLKMGLPTLLANRTAHNFSVCMFQLTHSVDGSLTSWSTVQRALLHVYSTAAHVYVALWTSNMLRVNFYEPGWCALFAFLWEVRHCYLGPKCVLTLLESLS